MESGAVIGAAQLQQLLAGFVAVLVLLGLLLWLLRRIQRGVAESAAGRRIEIVETQPLGLKHRLVLVRVGGRELLLGVTPTELRALDQWPASKAPQVPHAGESSSRRAS